MAITKVTSGLISADASSIDLNIDAGTLYLDVSENRVGIGTTSPDSPLEIDGGSSANTVLHLTSTTANTYLKISDSNTNEGNFIGCTTDDLTFFTRNAEKMRIDSSGNVGIGTTSPDANLHISSAGGTELHLQEETAGAAAQIKFTNNNNTFEIGADANPQIFFINTTGNQGSGLCIDTSNNVGIGETSPDTALHVKTANDTVALLESSDATAKLQIKDSDSTYGTSLCVTNEDFFMQINGGEKLRVDSSGNVGIAAIPSGEAAAAHVVRLGDRVCIAEYDDGSNPEQFNLFHNSDSSETYIETGSASVIQQKAGEIIFKSAASGSAGAAISFAERMKIDSSGNLQLGTTSSSQTIFQFLSATNGANTIHFGDGSSANLYRGYINYNHTNDRMEFATAGSERMRIDSNGTTILYSGSANTLHLNTSSSAAGTNNVIRVFSDSDINSGGNVRFVVYPSGNVQNSNNSYGAISDETKKENIVDATNKLDKLNQVRVRNFNFIGDDLKQIGVVAQELETIFPSMVEDIQDQDAEGNVLETSTKSVKYSVFVPILIKAIQEQQTIIDDLKTRIETLENA